MDIGAPLGGSRRRQWARRLAGAATALAGLATAASSLSPNAPARQRLLEGLEPGSAEAVAHAAGVLGGVCVLWLSIGVLQGRRRAGRAAVAVLAVLAVVHTVKGLDYEEALISLGVALALHRGALTLRRGEQPSRPLVAALVVLVALAGAYAATLTILLVSGHSPDAGAAVWRSARSLADGALPGGGLGTTARTVVHVLAGVVGVSVVMVALALLRPARGSDGHSTPEHARALGLVARHGGDSIAPFALRADKAFFFAHGGFLAYRTLRETAVVAGDPIGPPGCAPLVLAEFLEFTRARRWDLVLVGARTEALAGYRRLGLRHVQVGLEGVVDPRRFTLEGGAMKTVRKAVRRVARSGWTIEVLPAARLTPALAAELEAVEDAWRRGRRRLYGFAWAHDRLWGAPEDADDLYAIARSPAGEVRAFQRYVRFHGGLSLDAMRRLDDEPNGISDALVAATLGHARRVGLSEVSLNFAGFGHIMAADTLERRSHRVARWLLRRLHGRFQLERLARFTEKFGPAWRPRHLVYTGRTRLPLAALRVLQAEAYLPPPQATRRRDAWLPGPRPLLPAAGD